jgi:hypothetical protein
LNVVVEAGQAVAVAFQVLKSDLLMKGLFMRTLLLSMVCMLLVAAELFAGGPWTRQQGHGFVQLGFSALRAKNIYELDGSKKPINTLGDYTLQLYGEYGITDKLTASLIIPFKRETLDRLIALPGNVELFPGDSKNGIADIDVELKYGIVQSDVVVSAALWAGLPVGDNNQPNGLLTGDGELNVGVKLLAGKSFYPAPFYVTADIGYNRRSNNFSDEVLFNAEVGYAPIEQLYLLLTFAGKKSTKNGTAANASNGSTGLYTNDQEYLALIPKIYFKFNEHYGVSAGISTAFSGKNVAATLVYNIGVAYEF